jgi:hypothetical protein
MFSAFKSPLAAEYASACAVVLVSAIVGNYARDGMNEIQWAGGLAAILGSIAWAVMVRVWKEETAG